MPPPRANLQVSIIIPAKDEAAGLPATLAALATQTDLAGRPLPAGCFEVLVLANNCADATAEIARRQAHRWPHLALGVAEINLPKAQAHVGRARRLLMDEACARLELVRGTGIIASTDADTRVAPTWVAAIMAEIAAGADAVGGRISTEFYQDDQPELRSLRRIQTRDAAYRLLCTRLEHAIDPAPADPWPRHHQHFGASLAITTRAYRRVGGLPEVRFLEDEALCQRLRQHDLALRHSPRVQVLTSARREGRVEVGLSWQLREWLRMSQQQREPHVENPNQLARQWRLRRRLRAHWASGTRRPPETLAACLAVPVAVLQEQVRQAPTFGMLWEWALANAPGLRIDLLPLSWALRVLPPLILAHEPAPVVAEAVVELSAFPASRAGTFRAAAR
ncbi:glycosyltransferase [Hymenobacter antarcticus]|uniref:glycosyltransferase n=1 Tax=Hymenobacter antarcticus TaxID=486270 RepID=UPI0031EDB4C8